MVEKTFWKIWKSEKIRLITKKYLKYHEIFKCEYTGERGKFNHLYVSMLAAVCSILKNTPYYIIDALDYKMQSDFEFMDSVIEKYKKGEYEEGYNNN